MTEDELRHQLGDRIYDAFAPRGMLYQPDAEDPDNLEGPPRSPEEMARNARELDAVAPTPADKFALMFGKDERKTMRELLDRMAGEFSAILNTHPDLRTKEHDAIFKEYRNIKS